MHIFVCIKQTPDSASVYVDPISGQIDEERFVQILNPADACAIEAAVRLKEQLGGSITALTVGLPDAEGALRAALAIGADTAIRLWHPHCSIPKRLEEQANSSHGSSAPGGIGNATSVSRTGQGIVHQAAEWGPFSIAMALATAIHHQTPSPDLVICGDHSSDWASSTVGPALAQYLNLPQVTGVAQLRIVEAGNPLTLRLTRKLERGYRELLEAEPPLLLTVTSELNEPRYPSLPAHLAALKATIAVLDPLALSPNARFPTIEETTLLEMHVPRPRPRHIAAPDSRHSAFQRIGEIVASGTTGRKTRLVEGTPEELAKILVAFLREKGFL